MKDDPQRNEQSQAIKYSMIVISQRVLGLIGFLLAAGTFESMRGWIYFGSYFFVSVVTIMYMMMRHKTTLSERGKKRENTPTWDRWVLAIYVPLAFYGIHIAAGLDFRFNGELAVNNVMYIGLALYFLSSVFGIWPILENKHFESTARIQNDRNQSVVMTGPYRFIRHPGYFSIIVWAIAVPMIFGSLLTALISMIIIVVIVIRTSLEDKMLCNELADYLVYCKKVKYRLIPYIW